MNPDTSEGTYSENNDLRDPVLYESDSIGRCSNAVLYLSSVNCEFFRSSNADITVASSDILVSINLTFSHNNTGESFCALCLLNTFTPLVSDSSLSRYNRVPALIFS